jgi:hypothetical protein
VQVRGKISKYHDARGRDHLQVQVVSASQVLAPSQPLEKLLSTPEPVKLPEVEDAPHDDQTVDPEAE